MCGAWQSAVDNWKLSGGKVSHPRWSVAKGKRGSVKVKRGREKEWKAGGNQKVLTKKGRGNRDSRFVLLAVPSMEVDFNSLNFFIVEQQKTREPSL